MAKNPKNKEIIGILVLCGIITAVGTVILMKIGYEFKYSIIGGALLTILLIVPKKDLFLKQVIWSMDML